MRSTLAYVRNSSGVGMTVKELRDELSAIIRNQKGGGLVVHVDIIDRRSYEEERIAERVGSDDLELDETSIGEGTVFSVVVPTDYEFIGNEDPKPLGRYVRIRAVELLPDEES